MTTQSQQYPAIDWTLSPGTTPRKIDTTENLATTSVKNHPSKSTQFSTRYLLFCVYDLLILRNIYLKGPNFRGNQYPRDKNPQELIPVILASLHKIRENQFPRNIPKIRNSRTPQNFPPPPAKTGRKRALITPS